MNKILKYSIIVIIILLILFLIYTIPARYKECKDLSLFKCKFNPKCRVGIVPAGPNLPAMGPECVEKSYQGDRQKSVYFDYKNYERYEPPENEDECNDDSDCFVGGCNGESCTAVEGIETTCEEIYEIKDISCKCINTKCIWIKK